MKKYLLALAFVSSVVAYSCKNETENTTEEQTQTEEQNSFRDSVLDEAVRTLGNDSVSVDSTHSVDSTQQK